MLIVRKNLAAQKIEHCASETTLVSSRTVNLKLNEVAHQTVNVLLIVVTLYSKYAQAQIVYNQV